MERLEQIKKLLCDEKELLIKVKEQIKDKGLDRTLREDYLLKDINNLISGIDVFIEDRLSITYLEVRKYLK